MAPAKSSRNHDDGKAETAKERATGQTSAKMRRGASQQSSNLREVTNASATSAAAAAAARPATTQPTPGVRFLLLSLLCTSPGHWSILTLSEQLQWNTFDRAMLHSYTREHKLNYPSCFTSTYHQTILAQPAGIGAYSPTMLRRKKQRQSKEQLTQSVRKHFNGLGIQENDVIVDLIYKLRSDDLAKRRGPQKLSGIASE
ncbi:hypothetical protein GMORB2_0351 [Geosmithia morbida]|uniref:Histone deacetylase complex subunit SAP30 Sin3 binding domain-containing protein n=1 Tax=Geosmithia morbida TaxID=1094350 RepID=A0A9P4Z120_9HYPO|nr:uncharacterized protein GMORB2_0351 [Geosmithia morbida]KAF4126615.1 hypothetical protein GMORB2_0351 [Geosmithia morbida]